MELSTIISIGSFAISTGKAAYEVISGIRKAENSQTAEIVRQLERLNNHVEKLSDSIWYAQDLDAVRQVAVQSQPRITDLREVRQALEPVQRVIGDEIISSAMILTPDMLRHAMTQDPWNVLDDVRPLNFARPRTDPSWVPLLFELDSVRYVGWQKQGILPTLFKCEYRPGVWDMQMVEHVVPRLLFDWVTVSSGEFRMGSDNTKDSLDSDFECPQHTVHLAGYRISRTPVTNAQYQQFVDATGHSPPQHWEGGRIPAGKAEHPVVYVLWDDAVAFCDWAGVRLPTEAQWEKAARGTDGRIYPWGNQVPDRNRCNFDNNEKGTTPVGSYSQGKSPYGCLDMAGNVWEWCADWLAFDYYERSPTHDPAGPLTGMYRVLRGGCFYYLDLNHVRCAFRYGDFSGSSYDYVGFRVVSPGL